MKTISFFKLPDKTAPVLEFISSLESKQKQKIAWVLKLIQEHEKVPKTYLKKLVNTNDIWEVRIQMGNNIFRLLGFFEGNSLVILTNGFQKKTQKTPKNEIKLAENRKQQYKEQLNG
jgi:phage-related protein